METAREYLEGLYRKGHRGFFDLDIDEKRHLTGLLVLEGKSEDARDAIVHGDRIDEIATLLARYCVTADPDMRIEALSKLITDMTYSFENRINTLFERYHETYQEGEAEAREAFRQGGQFPLRYAGKSYY